MKKFRLKNLLIYLQGVVILELFSVYPNSIFAKGINKNDWKELNSSSEVLKFTKIQKKIDISIEVSLSKNKVLKDIKANGEKLFNLLAFEQNDLAEKYFVEIDSDTQYRDKDVFVAEGNAIIYLSDASLKGDLIKYDLKKKLLTVVGNVIFKKGQQYFEASKFSYNLVEDIGYIDNVYGLLDSNTFINDIKLEIDKNNREEIEQKKQVSQLADSKNVFIGSGNKFEEDDYLNIKSVDLKNSSLSRVRYKAEKLTYNSKTLKSKKIFFTNDIYNEPQVIFVSKNFSANIVENKLEIVSKNSSIILDKKLKIPIGRKSILEGGEESFIEYGFGADFKDKDGYFLFRKMYPRKLFKDYSFQLTPYLLFQRALEGSTNSYTGKDSSIFSKKVNRDITFSDYFALDLDIKGKKYDWDVESNLQLNSLNTERLGESIRANLIFSKRINLNKTNESQSYVKNNINLNKDEVTEINLKNDKDLDNFIDIEETEQTNSISGEQIEFNSMKKYSEKSKKLVTNFLDFKFYNIFREEIKKDFATEEIYLGSGLNISNKRAWTLNDKISNLFLIYDIGYFLSESKDKGEFNELFRYTFAAKYNNKFPLWKKPNLDKRIDKSYKFSPKVIEQSLYWSTGFQPEIYFYSDSSSQTALKLSTGPSLTLGSFKKEFLDYTKVSANYKYVIKGGESPFLFDNVDNDPRINFNFEQQIYGPLLFSFDTTLNLNSGSYTNENYALDFQRRAYSIGAYYNSTDESVGIRFNIFNFDYAGISSKF